MEATIGAEAYLMVGVKAAMPNDFLQCSFWVLCIVSIKTFKSSWKYNGPSKIVGICLGYLFKTFIMINVSEPG